MHLVLAYSGSYAHRTVRAIPFYVEDSEDPIASLRTAVRELHRIEYPEIPLRTFLDSFQAWTLSFADKHLYDILAQYGVYLEPGRSSLKGVTLLYNFTQFDEIPQTEKL